MESETFLLGMTKVKPSPNKKANKNQPEKANNQNGKHLTNSLNDI